MNLKAILGFIVLFAVYHSSEMLGNNPIYIIGCFILFFVAAHFIAKILGEQGLTAFGLKRKNSFIHLFIGYLIGFFFFPPDHYRFTRIYVCYFSFLSK